MSIVINWVIGVLLVFLNFFLTRSIVRTHKYANQLAIHGNGLFNFRKKAHSQKREIPAISNVMLCHAAGPPIETIYGGKGCMLPLHNQLCYKPPINRNHITLRLYTLLSFSEEKNMLCPTAALLPWLMNKWKWWTSMLSLANIIHCGLANDKL